jgi:hypothetical protein
LKIREIKSEILQNSSIYNESNDSMDFFSELMNSIGENKGKLYLFEHFFFWFRDYFKFYLKTIRYLMKEETLLPINWRYFIAIMAASAMKSNYMLKTLEESFLNNGGDEKWLIHGLKVVPEKLKRVSKIINIISHQPWKITQKDIKVSKIFKLIIFF